MFAFTESESSMLTLETAVEVKKIPLVGPYSQEELLNVLYLFWERKCKVRAVSSIWSGDNTRKEKSREATLFWHLFTSVIFTRKIYKFQ